MFVQLCLEVLKVMSTESTNIFYLIYYGVIIIVTLGGADIFTAALHIICICKEVLPLYLTFVMIWFRMFRMLRILRKCL